MQPEFITFTGVDDWTDLDELQRVADRFHGRTEWGVLYSDKRRANGDPRYPTLATIDKIRDLKVHLSMHLCGAVARWINEGGDPGISIAGLGRIQVNHTTPNPMVIKQYASQHRVVAIAQTRDSFPATEAVQWLFDRSGGKGQTPDTWPQGPQKRLVGFAGGISPDNVASVVSSIDASRFWIDMESGVRTDDRLDLRKCETVLEAILEPIAA